jgi:hypothetical protein
MSIVLSNIDNLLFESEIEIDDIFLTDLFEGKLKTAAKLGAAGAAAGGAAAYAKRVGKEVSAARGVTDDSALDVVKGDASSLAAKAGEKVSSSVAKAKNYVSGGETGVSKLSQDASAGAAKVGKFASDNSMAIGAAGAAIGAGLLYKYFTSISHYKNKVASLEAKAKSAPADKKPAIQKALSTVKAKLTAAQAKARTEHGSFIEKSRQMKAQVAELNKAGKKPEAMKLQAKLDKRQKFLSKIGANI